MNNKSFHVQEFSGDINNGKDADNLVLILKPAGGVIVSKKSDSDIKDRKDGRKLNQDARMMTD